MLPSMTNSQPADVALKLADLELQPYPLTVEKDEALALLTCAQRLLEEVPDEARSAAEPWYRILTAALWHPA